MRLINCLILIFFSLISNVLFSQQTDGNTYQNSEDSLVTARRKQYEATLKFIEEIERRRKKDPKRYADSVALIKEQRRYTKASIRIDEYRKAENFNTLVELDLSGARLKEIPDWIFKAKNLEILVLDYNQISVLPKKLIELKSLKRIYWRFNNLGSDKIKIPRLDKIEKIDLTGNLLTKLPKVHRLGGLKELVLEDNLFEKIPTWRGRRLKELTELDLSLNPIKLDRRWYWMLDHIEILKMNKCHIDYLHPSLYRMKGLTVLQIQVNDLRSIPEGISALEHLTKLSFYKNELNELPMDFFDLKNLRVVDLYYNEFEKIPLEINKLDDLEILYLSFNKLYDIPAEIGDLSHLQQLYIHHNRLSEIPKRFGELKKLKTFHFQNNYIPSFPNQILDMNNLVDLDISNTDIRSIPPGIAELKLKNFYWRNLGINLNDLDNKDTRETLLQLIDQGTNVVPNISIQELSTN